MARRPVLLPALRGGASPQPADVRARRQREPGLRWPGGWRALLERQATGRQRHAPALPGVSPQRPPARSTASRAATGRHGAGAPPAPHSARGMSPARPGPPRPLRAAAPGPGRRPGPGRSRSPSAPRPPQPPPRRHRQARPSAGPLPVDGTTDRALHATAYPVVTGAADPPGIPAAGRQPGQHRLDR